MWEDHRCLQLFNLTVIEFNWYNPNQRASKADYSNKRFHSSHAHLSKCCSVKNIIFSQCPVQWVNIIVHGTKSPDQCEFIWLPCDETGQRPLMVNWIIGAIIRILRPKSERGTTLLIPFAIVEQFYTHRSKMQRCTTHRIISNWGRNVPNWTIPAPSAPTMAKTQIKTFCIGAPCSNILGRSGA